MRIEGLVREIARTMSFLLPCSRNCLKLGRLSVEATGRDKEIHASNINPHGLGRLATFLVVSVTVQRGTLALPDLHSSLSIAAILAAGWLACQM